MAFIIICVISFISLRPLLIQVRQETKRDWEKFEAAVQLRNKALPGLTEALRGFEPGHSKLVEEIIEARAVTMRPGNPDRFVAAVDEIDRRLEQVANLLQTKPKLGLYAPFSTHWPRVRRRNDNVRMSRLSYNQSVRLYNGLLKAFPQNLISSLFGFVPLSAYPLERSGQ
jgi:LemA protein